MKNIWFGLVTLIVAVIISIVTFDSMPNEVATHWGVNGEPDGYASKWVGAFIAPALMVAFLLVKIWLPKIDPKKENYEQFKKSYSITMDIVFAFFLVLHIATTLYNIGYDVKIEFVVCLSTGVMFIVLGNYMPKFKHNYFVGIRIPWTLNSEEVWKKTHRFGGKVFVAIGLIMAIGVFLPINSFITILAPLVIGIIIITYMAYRYHKEE